MGNYPLLLLSFPPWAGKLSHRKPLFSISATQVFQTNPAFRMAEDANQSEVLPVEGANTLDSNQDLLRGEERKYVQLPKQVFFYAIVNF